MKRRFDKRRWRRVDFLIDLKTLAKLKEMMAFHGMKNTSDFLRGLINDEYDEGVKREPE